MALCAALLLAHAAHSEVSLDSVRIAAKDTVALAKFYHAAFGMQEVNRIENPGGTEVFVNFGATVEAAKANKNPLMVLLVRNE
jgi:catechol-2,3-dioxygenase